MFKENIMKKIAGLSLAAIVMMPGVVKAAGEGVADADGVCVADTQAHFVDCLGDNNTKTITINGADSTTEFEVEESYTGLEGLTLTQGKLTVKGSLTIEGTLTTTATDSSVVITDGGILTVNAKDGNTAITGGASITLGSSTSTSKKGSLVVSTNNATTNKPENTAIAIASSVTSVTAYGKSTINVSAGNIAGNITLNDSAKLTATASEASGTLSVNDDASANVKTISGTLTVNGEGADVRYANEDALVTLTKGVLRTVEVDDDDVETVVVKTAGVESVSIAAGEKYVITNVDKDVAITAANGAIIVNEVSGKTTIKVTVNGVLVDVVKGTDYVVNNGSTEVPGDTTQTPDGDVTVDKNPATGDSIMSYVTLALTSVASLGLAVKKFLF